MGIGRVVCPRAVFVEIVSDDRGGGKGIRPSQIFFDDVIAGDSVGVGSVGGVDGTTDEAGGDVHAGAVVE